MAMSTWRRNPTLYEINTRVWLSDLTKKYGAAVELSSVPAAEWDTIAQFGFDGVWMMGVWERSPAGIAIANRNQGLLADFCRALPDFRTRDNVGSPYCVRNYVVDKHLGSPVGLASARKELDRRGALLIYDEAQTGLGKLGQMFAYQVCGVRPDVLTLSKHLGGGLAVSAAITSDDVSDRATRNGLSIGHSHSSDPLACKAGIASIDEIVENDLPKRALEIGNLWQANLRALQQRYEIIGDIRGRGLLQGIELVRDRRTKEPATQIAADIYRHCLADRLMFSVRGKFKNVLRFVPPFTTTNAQLDKATEILEAGMRRAIG